MYMYLSKNEQKWAMNGFKDVRGVVWEKFLMTITMPNNMSSMKYALKSVPGIADVGVLHGDGPRTPPRCLERSGKGFK